MDAAAMLAAYDAQLRGHVPDLPPGVQAERDGPLVRTVGWSHGGMVEYRDLGGLEGAALDELIARQAQIFAQRGESFEWKSHGHDLPADLPDRLRAAGFVAEPQETVVVAPTGAIAREPAPPPGVSLREVTDELGFHRVAAMEARIWGGEHRRGIAELLSARRAFDPLSLSVFAAEASGEVICAAWIRFRGPAVSFATLQGGATLPEWRSRGVYRALVSRRAVLAAERGCEFLHVDASDDSRPILERLGFVPIATTTPFRWSPPRRELSS
jgi:GNAT superfamily N-acetyltransferase